MNDINELLKQGDPVAREAELDPMDLDRMRSVATTTLPESAHGFHPGPMFVAASIAVAIASGVALGRQQSLPGRSASSTGTGQSGSVVPAPETRQLQFTTPGGTRIIWVFDPNFKL